MARPFSRRSVVFAGVNTQVDGKGGRGRELESSAGVRASVRARVPWAPRATAAGYMRAEKGIVTAVCVPGSLLQQWLRAEQQQARSREQLLGLAADIAMRPGGVQRAPRLVIGAWGHRGLEHWAHALSKALCTDSRRARATALRRRAALPCGPSPARLALGPHLRRADRAKTAEAHAYAHAQRLRNST